MKNLTIVIIVTVLSLIAGGTANATDRYGSKHAVTLWWVIFNNPEACTFNPGGAEKCGTVDVFGQAFLDSMASGSPDPSLINPNTDAGLAVLYATGGVSNGRGKLDLVASIYRTPADGLTLTGSPISGDSAPIVNSSTAPDVGEPEINDTSYSFTVTYTDDNAIDTSTVDIGDVTVTGNTFDEDKILPPTVGQGNRFGFAVDVDGDRLAVTLTPPEEHHQRDDQGRQR